MQRLRDHGGVWGPLRRSGPVRKSRLWTPGDPRAFKALGEELKPEKSRLWTPEEVPRQRRFRSMILMFMGRRGQNKSATMTALAEIQQRRYAALNQGRPPERQIPFSVAANYRVSFADYVDPNLVRALAQYPEWASDLDILLDEIGTVAPSRRSMSTDNVNLSATLTQVRKRRNNISFTTQFPQTIDFQLLMQVDLFTRCYAFNNNRSTRMYIFDHWGQWTGKDYRKPWPPQPGWEDWFIDIHHVDQIWGDYDTDEEQVPVWYKNRDELLERKGWGFGNEDDGSADDPAEVPLPDTLDEFLDAVRDTVNIMAILDYAREYEPKITRVEVAKMLEDRGYSISKEGSWLATREDQDLA